MWRNLITGHPPHDDVIKWKHFPRYWPFVRGIHQSAVFPAQRPVTRSFDVFFDLHLNKRLSEQSCGWWFGTPSHPFWRHYDVLCFRHLLRASPVPRDILQSTGLISLAWIGDRRHWFVTSLWGARGRLWHHMLMIGRRWIYIFIYMYMYIKWYHIQHIRGLNKQSRRWWFETHRNHYDVIVM